MKKNIIIAAAVILMSLLSACGGAARAPVPTASSPAQNTAPAPSASYQDSGSDAFDYAYEPEYGLSSESYLAIDENKEKLTQNQSMLTFSLKVDTASYTNVQRYIESGNLPPKDAVRTEELINYFRYDGDLRFGSDPFAIYAEVAPSPFDSGKQMAFIRVKTRDIDKEELPSSNLTFLIDTSGSMNSYDKLPLLKESFSMLVDTLDENDRVSIVTYAGSSAVLLDGVSGDEKKFILRAIEELQAGGSTAGAEGILTAYRLAEENFLENGNNRVILATDGDFNVGVSSNEELSRLIKNKRDSGVYLSILGFGTGNIRDDLMETLSRDGNGNYSYINNLNTAKKVLVEELASNLFTVADDVKAQIEFNPENVKSYRLIGYENRTLRNEDFENDKKDAGEIGAGTDVVVLFELELQNPQNNSGLKYQSQDTTPKEASGSEFSNELFEVRIRYKDPGQSQSKLVTCPVVMGDMLKYGSSDLQFACAVAAFGDILRGSAYRSTDSSEILSVAEDSLGRDIGGYRADFLDMVKRYRQLAK